MADCCVCRAQQQRRGRGGGQLADCFDAMRSSVQVWNSCGTVLITLLIFSITTTAARQETCNMEVFEARCDVNTGPPTVDGRHRVPASQQQQLQQQTHQLILMQSAMYGRMRIGRCATADYGVIGCGVDVLDVMDWRCSGRRRCRVKVPDDDMYAMTDCPQQVSSYLEASYTCITVATDVQSRCATGTPIQLTDDSGYIVGPPAATAHNIAVYVPSPIDSSPHGIVRPCTWHIRVAPGQRINLTLYDFSRHFRSSGSSGSHVSLTSGPSAHQSSACVKYAVVTESMIGGGATSEWAETANGRGQAAGGEDRKAEGAGPVKSKPVRSATICGGGGANDAVRQRYVYSSESNAINVETVVISSQKLSTNGEWVESGGGGAESASSSGSGGSSTGNGRSETDGVRFLIKYDAIGCADLQLPGNVVVRRDGQLAVTVSCENSTHSIKHHLVCKDRQWTGDLPTCSNSHQGNKGPATNTEIGDWWSNMTNDWTYAILTTVGLGVALGVLVGVGLLLATLAYCRRRGRYSSATLRLTDKYCTTMGVASGGVNMPTSGGDYYERGTLQLTQTPAGGHGPYSVKDVIMASSGEYTARLLPPGRTGVVDMATRTGSGLGKDDLCLCACSTSTVMTHPGVFIDRQLSQPQRSTASMFTRELGVPLHAEYEMTA